MHCALPVPKLLFSSPMATLRNTKVFSHADLKVFLPSNKRLVAGRGFYVKLHTRFKFEHAICAFATIESESIALSSSNSETQIGSDWNFGASQDDSEEDSGMEEKESVRRSRISRANKGNIPWNKGKKHTPETIQRIRERTKIAMQDPKVMSCKNNCFDDTKSKIAQGVKEGWRRRSEKNMIQQRCHVEWCNMIAEMTRIGFYGETELQWDSYELLQEELKRECPQSLHKRISMLRKQNSSRGPKSPEQRKRIAEAIRAKWADPEYRDRVQVGMVRHHGLPSDREKRQNKNAAKTSTSNRKIAAKPNIVKSEMKGVTVHKETKKNEVTYKDPMVSTKLEMIKKLKDQRLAREMKIREAVERAKLLIGEAEKAAKDLEVAALKNPLAHASLVEARNLIAKASQMLHPLAGPTDSESFFD
ncbi:Origin recognition complex subunit 2 [Carex littledalei]|uniref:Origin recognition complex subunit 2 n=1 Tax=Carex littledalei TaxID=544730 RepID=A0A833QR37_9POAL|nr:Origin recognition complex subunit 2 [Carex littledalei]